jgi:hypothetical protein
MRSYYYLILIVAGIALFFINVIVTGPLTVQVTDFLGLTSRLGLFYWVGLGLTLLGVAFAFLSKKRLNDIVYVGLLLTVVLFIFGADVFLESNARNSIPYWFAGNTEYILQHNIVSLTSVDSLDRYNAFPGANFISTFLVSVTGANVLDLIRYVPLLWGVFFAVLSYILGKALSLEKSASFALALLALSGFWVGQNYFSAQAFAYLIYVSMFILVLLISEQKKGSIPAFIAYIALVMTHMLTSLTALIALAFKKKVPKILFIGLIAVFILWLVYVATAAVKIGFNTFFLQILNMDFFTFSHAVGYGPVSSLQREISRDLRLFYPLTFALLICVSLILYFRGMVKQEHKGMFQFCLGWILSILPLLILRYGVEIDLRVYIYALIPMASLIILGCQRYKKMLLVPLVLLIVLHVPATYSNEFSTQTYSADLSGGAFYLRTTDFSKPFFYWGSLGYLFYLDPQTVTYHSWKSIPETAYRTGQGALRAFDNVTYILNGPQGRNDFIYNYGFDLVKEWSQNNTFNSYYDNGFFEIYSKTK